MQTYRLFISKISALMLIALVGCSAILPSLEVSAYSSSTNQSSQKAVTYVKNYISRLERSGYSDEEIVSQLTNLRSIFVKRQQSSLYSGRSSNDVNMIILELENAISWYSQQTSNNQYYYCPNYGRSGYSYGGYYEQPYSPYNPQQPYQNYYYTQPNYQYYQPQYPQYPYYNYYSPVISNQTLRVGDTYFTNNTYTATETRTNLTRDNSSNSYKDYDMYTFVLQNNGIASNQPNSSRFLTTSYVREVTTAQGRNIRVSFGAEYDQSKVRTIRTAAQGAYRTSQSTVSLSPSFTDSFFSLSPDEFSRQSLLSGYVRTYKTYKLYIAKDDTQAFIMEYQETASQNNNYYYPGYGQNLTGLDINSFTDYSGYFSHNYLLRNTTSKQYKQYIYTPVNGSDVTTIYSNLGINVRMSYQTGTSRYLNISNQQTLTYVNGYTINSGYVSAVESTFAGYAGYSYVTLPSSSSQFTFSPQTSSSFQYNRLSDGTYRQYRLLVATDGSEAYLTEYVENNPYY